MRARSGFWVALTVSLFALVAATCPLDITPADAVGTTFKTARVESADLSLQYPSSWVRYPLTKKALAKQQRTIAEKNPGIALSPARQARFLRAMAFWAADLQTAYAGGFLSNVSVAKARSGTFPESLAAFTAKITEGFQQQLGATVVSTSAVKVGGKQRPGERRDSYRVDGVATITRLDGSSVTSRVGQLYVPYRGDGGDIVTVTTTGDAAGVQVIDDVLGSVRRI